MHRFYLPAAQCHQPVLRLSETDSHHAAHVLRLRAGERVIVLDGAGMEYLCQTKELGKREVILEVTQKVPQPRLAYELHLFQAITKAKAMDLIVQKATELGARRIIPVLSERSVPQTAEEQASHKVERWQSTAIEAIKQSGSAWLPEIEAPVSVPALLGRGEKFDLNFVASLQPEARHPRMFFKNYHEEQKQPPGSIAVWVGPEGDFTPAEMNAIRSAGAWPITLGPSILRSETAAIYCLSILNYELQAPVR